MPDILTDWTFWSFVVAAAAVALSQLPPVKLWFKKPSLDVEVHTRMALTHKVGNPNAQLHIIITNDGGRPVRVRGMSISFSRNGEHRFTLPVQNYLQHPADKTTVLFTPFTLRPDDEWSHIANFLNYFSREDERTYRQMESAIRTNILGKRRQVQHGPDLIEADQQYVDPIIAFYSERFDWLHGEYRMTLKVDADSVTCEKHYDFTIFEYEADELRSAADDYKYGAGTYWDRTDRVISLGVTIRESQA